MQIIFPPSVLLRGGGGPYKTWAFFLAAIFLKLIAGTWVVIYTNIMAMLPGHQNYFFCCNLRYVICQVVSFRVFPLISNLHPIKALSCPLCF